MRNPAAVLTALAIALSGNSGLAQVVATTASSPNYWYEWSKALLPPLITGGIAYLGFRIAFANNNKTKKIEILYKEQIEAVKLIIGVISEHTASFTTAAPRIESSIDYKGILTGFLASMRILRGSQLPILNPKSREVVARFVLLNIGIKQFLDIVSKESVELKTKSDLQRDNTEFKNLVREMIDYSYLVSDVLYRDLEFPGWKAITPKRLEAFDNEKPETLVFQED